MNCEKVVNYLRTNLKEYIQEHNLKSLVVGVSGGADSALVCALAFPVCKELNIELIGRSLPILTNKQDELDRAEMIGQNFCTDFKEVDLSKTYQAMIEAGIDEIDHSDTEWTKNEYHNYKIRQGNIKARTRMIYLYNLASAHRGLVLSTDNLTELLVGFWTLHGDVGDYGMIQQYWKGEVYEMLTYLAKKHETNLNQFAADALTACVVANPTDGLGITNSDLDQLGAQTYDEVDLVLKTWLTDDIDAFNYYDHLGYKGRLEDYNEFEKYRATLVEHPVVKRYEATHFKRANPFNVDRMFDDDNE